MNIKKFFGPHVSCRPGRVTVNQHIFKSGLSVRTFEEANFVFGNQLRKKSFNKKIWKVTSARKLFFTML